MTRTLALLTLALLTTGCAIGPLGGGTPPLATSVPVGARVATGESLRTTAQAARAPASAMPADLSVEGVRAADPNLWLEEVHGQRAGAWVHDQNARTVDRLERDARFETYRQQAFAILAATDRIPTPHFQGGAVYNFWQDARHPKGVWRRTTLAGYRADAPAWETVLDIDALAAAEGKDWVYKGADCLAPAETRCLVRLSIGGSDAVEIREFDTGTKSWVPGGFRLPTGKHRLTWEDQDHLIVATDFGPLTGGAPSLTESGYAWTARRLARGQALAQAPEVFRGARDDGGYGVSPLDLRDAEGRLLGVLIERPLDTFNAEYWLVRGPGPAVRLNLPARMTSQGVFGRDQFVFTAEEDWNGIEAGALVSASLDSLVSGRPQAGVVFAPTARQSVSGVALGRSRIVVSMLDDVNGRIAVFTPGTARSAGWTRTDMAVADASVVELIDSSRAGDALFYTVQGLLVPTQLHLADTRTRADAVVKALPAQFDASTHVVEQMFATSADGTRVPYFIVHPRDLALDGTAPTLVFGYGGFNNPYLPLYTPQMGKLWLEHGGTYVVANIRGGGEFGPAWHDAALKENRQRAFDDFAAVIRDLEARHITSPRHLGIYGRSNGGVLTSVTLTQHPELINAAVIESPLVDMLRYPFLPAGASWIGEYGDPRLPADAAYIARYSGYQNVRADVAYPQVYITTNTGDDRVHPGHARKLAERLSQFGQPYLFYEDTSGGHSFDANPVNNARRWARHYVYLSQRLMD